MRLIYRRTANGGACPIVAALNTMEFSGMLPRHAKERIEVPLDQIFGEWPAELYGVVTVADEDPSAKRVFDMLNWPGEGADRASRWGFTDPEGNPHNVVELTPEEQMPWSGPGDWPGEELPQHWPVPE